MPTGECRAGQQGFVYIALLIGMAIMGIGLGATSEVWTQTRQREKEQELLFVGNQIRQAISHFYLQSPPNARRFPTNLEELTQDLRTPDKPQRYLRKVYADPITGSTSWGELRLPGGQLVGVYSTSFDKPIKVAGFALRDKALADQEHYSDWVFRSALPAANPLLAPGTGYTTQGAPPVAAPNGPQRGPAAPAAPSFLKPFTLSP